jgi:hypothetical protein
VAQYDTKGFQPSLITPFLSAQQLQVRIAVLQGLSTYAQGLAEIAGDDQMTEFDNQTKALGQQLLSLDKQKPVANTGITTKDMAAFATAVDTLGRFFVQYKREQGLKKIVSANDSDIREVCDLFSREIGGSMPSGGTPPSSGLRNQLWDEYTEAMTSYDLYLEKNRRRLTVSEQVDGVRELAKMVVEQRSADAMLAATAKALGDLASTHAKLAQALSHPDSGIQAILAQLEADAKSAANFYNALQAKSK